MMGSQFIWETAGSRERADMIRRHRYSVRTTGELRDLFCLTQEGVDMILRGDNWRSEYEAPAINYIEGEQNGT